MKFFHFTFLWRLCLIPSLFSRSDEDIEAKCAPSLTSLLTSLLYIYRPRLSNHEQRRSIDHCSNGRSGCRRPTVLWTSQPQAILLPANLMFQETVIVISRDMLDSQQYSFNFYLINAVELKAWKLWKLFSVVTSTRNVQVDLCTETTIENIQYLNKINMDNSLILEQTKLSRIPLWRLGSLVGV